MDLVGRARSCEGGMAGQCERVDAGSTVRSRRGRGSANCNGGEADKSNEVSVVHERQPLGRPGLEMAFAE